MYKKYILILAVLNFSHVAASTGVKDEVELSGVESSVRGSSRLSPSIEATVEKGKSHKKKKKKEKKGKKKKKKKKKVIMAEASEDKESDNSSSEIIEIPTKSLKSSNSHSVSSADSSKEVLGNKGKSKSDRKFASESSESSKPQEPRTKIIKLTQEQFEELVDILKIGGCEAGYYRCSGCCWRITREWWSFASGMFGLLAGGVGSFGSLLTLDDTHRSYLGYASATFTFLGTAFAALNRFATNAATQREGDLEYQQQGRLRVFLRKYGFEVPKSLNSFEEQDDVRESDDASKEESDES